MESRQRWASRILGGFGALVWGAGVMLHLDTVGIAVQVARSLFSGGTFWPLPGLQSFVFVLVAIMAGPIAVLVGGGLRFLAGLLNERKVGGDRVHRIVFWHWLRYEAMALGIALMLMAAGSMLVVINGGTPAWFVLIPVTVLFGGIFLCGRSGRWGQRADEMMWSVRAEGIQRGDVPVPAGTVPPRTDGLTNRAE